MGSKLFIGFSLSLNRHRGAGSSALRVTCLWVCLGINISPGLPTNSTCWLELKDLGIQEDSPCRKSQYGETSAILNIWYLKTCH